MTGFWTPERLSTLKAMYIDGKTYTDIALAIGCTRNAVSGRIDRLATAGEVIRYVDRLNRRAFREKTAPKSVDVRRPKPVKIEPANIDPTIPGVTLLDLPRNGCRFPVTGSFAETLFCGQKQAPDCPYCTGHRARCWTGQRMITERGERRRAA